MSTPPSDTPPPAIWIQPGTRLHMVVCRASCVEIWTSTDCRTGDSDKWHGTFLEVHYDGAVFNVTRHTDDTVTVFRIKKGQDND